jgi:hypothetical protein
VRFDASLQAFAQALRDPASPAPPQTRGREGRPDARRFAVYRNNVAVGLIGAIEARYPVTRRLVGDDFFRAMARVFAASAKPRSPVLIHYGADFPDFVSRFEPAREIAYLPDVARLENAWVEAYHAADAAPLALAALGEVDPADFATLRFVPHPAARLLRFAHPAASIWAAHQEPGEPRPPADWRGEEALVARPQADVAVRVLPPGGWDFAAALFAGAALGEAAEACAREDFDPGSHLVGLLEAGAFQSFR